MSERTLTLNSEGGLALGFVNVGNLTSISNVEVAFSSNENIDMAAVIFRGGNVNAKYLSLLYCGEQGISLRLDNGYQGKMQVRLCEERSKEACVPNIDVHHRNFRT